MTLNRLLVLVRLLALDRLLVLGLLGQGLLRRGLQGLLGWRLLPLNRWLVVLLGGLRLGWIRWSRLLARRGEAAQIDLLGLRRMIALVGWFAFALELFLCHTHTSLPEVARNHRVPP